MIAQRRTSHRQRGRSTPTATLLPGTLLVMAVTLLTACATGPEPSAGTRADHTSTSAPAQDFDDLGHLAPEAELQRSEVVLAALGHLDAPYRYGGNDATGLDCSALVQRAYREAGQSVPRTTGEQARAVTRRSGDPQPGDVIFFAIHGNQIDHVGVYLGDARFVHAPSSRGKVRIERLDNPYWQPRTRFAGHFFD